MSQQRLYALETSGHFVDTPETDYQYRRHHETSVPVNPMSEQEYSPSSILPHPHKKSFGKRKGPLDPANRAATAEVRKLGACQTCRKRKIKCVHTRERLGLQSSTQKATKGAPPLGASSMKTHGLGSNLEAQINFANARNSSSMRYEARNGEPLAQSTMTREVLPLQKMGEIPDSSVSNIQAINTDYNFTQPLSQWIPIDFTDQYVDVHYPPNLNSQDYAQYEHPGSIAMSGFQSEELSTTQPQLLQSLGYSPESVDYYQETGQAYIGGGVPVMTPPDRFQGGSFVPDLDYYSMAGVQSPSSSVNQAPRQEMSNYDGEVRRPPLD